MVVSITRIKMFYANKYDPAAYISIRLQCK